ncbi:MAG: hypothetical protein M3Y18_02720 [Candidatus Eremiobacteraeota bacterium]|nr:hypothetical protein [Candidatus Eremiobacteraeota bacterium]
MKRRRRSPTAAVAWTRLRKEARTAVYVCAASAVAGFLQPHGVPAQADPFATDTATRELWIAGPIAFGTLLGILIASIQRGAGRLRELELIEQSAPLYGRELARATALVPAVVVAAAMLTYWIAQFLSGFAAPPAFFAESLAAVIAATIVALSATLREGATRYLYAALACGVSAIAYVLAIYVDTLGAKPPPSVGHYYDVIGGASELIFCTAIGFIALRQYGEALARYDPVPAFTVREPRPPRPVSPG